MDKKLKFQQVKCVDCEQGKITGHAHYRNGQQKSPWQPGRNQGLTEGGHD